MRKAAPRAPVQGSARVAAARPTERRLTMGGRQQWYAGVDWGSQSHHVVLTDGDGRKIGERSFKHGGEGLAEMAAWLMAASCAAEPGQILAAIEVPQLAVVVETLMGRGFKVHAINPKQMDRFRDRFTMAGAKDDSRDAEVMASALRTDPRCFRSLAAADPIIVELREWSRITPRISASNRTASPSTACSEQLWRYFPALLELRGRPRRRMAARTLGSRADAEHGEPSARGDDRQTAQTPSHPPLRRRLRGQHVAQAAGARRRRNGRSRERPCRFARPAHPPAQPSDQRRP